MPIIHIGSKLFFFSHIPKCGGHSLERYFYGHYPNSLGFFDWLHNRDPQKTPWSTTSPQHVEKETLKRIFPVNFFDYNFAIVRNPYSRLKSAFQFNKDVLGLIEKTVNINEFIKNFLPGLSQSPGTLDNHFLPQTNFIDERSQNHIFKLENHGVEKAINWVEQMSLGGPTLKELPHFNSNTTPQNTKELELNNSSIALIKLLYKQDFENFGYDESICN